MPKVVKLIQSLERAGTGKKNDPIRMCPQLHTLDGKTIAVYDPHTKEMYFRPNNLDIKY